MPPNRAAPVVFQVAESVGRFDQRWPLAYRGIADTDSVRGGGEPKLLFHAAGPPIPITPSLPRGEFVGDSQTEKAVREWGLYMASRGVKWAKHSVSRG